MKEIKFDSKIEKEFYDFLLKNKIPEYSILIQPTVNGKTQFRPDIAIINPNTKEYIAIFEIKESSALKERGICQVYKYLDALENNAVRAFLALYDNNGGFNLFTKRLVDGKDEIVEEDVSSILNFDNLMNTYSASTVRNNNIQKKSAIKSLNKVCYFLAAIFSLILILDICFKLKYGISILTFERLSALGIIIILVLFPSLQRIKIYGIELEKKSLQNINAEQEGNNIINNSHK